MALHITLRWLLWLPWLTPIQGLACRNRFDTGQTSTPPKTNLRFGHSPTQRSRFEAPPPYSQILPDTPTTLPAPVLPNVNSIDRTSPAAPVAFVTKTVTQTVIAEIFDSCCSSEQHTVVTKWVQVDGSSRPTKPSLPPISSRPLRPNLAPSKPAPTTSTANMVTYSNDIFADPVDTKEPPPQIGVRSDHPVPRKGIKQEGPLQTNKFYANFFLEDQTCPTWTYPYSVAWAAGKGATSSWGMACSHIDANQQVFGQEKYAGASSYFASPVGIQSMVISAKELGKDTSLSIDSMTAFSARVHLSKDGGSPPAISFPLVQGMAYVTAQFNGGMPVIRSGVLFKTMTRLTQDPKRDTAKYSFVLEDGTTWRLYAYKTKGDPLELNVINNGLAEAIKPFFGVVQLCKDPGTNGSEALFDDGAGIFPVTLNLSGTASGREGKYSFNFQKDGHDSGELYMFALPHHVASFAQETTDQIQSLRLQTPSKGVASLVKGTSWTMVEPNLPTTMGFAPWDPDRGSIFNLSENAKGTIRAAASQEVSQNMIAQSNLDSMYFSGKALAKFGAIIYVINDMLGDKGMAQNGLNQLKAAFAIFAANKQKYPLVRETAWNGVVSSASYATGDAGADFGNGYYNDHHFHYGYHILAAAVIGYLDANWARENADYVNALVRDTANPSAKDKLFPMFRNFDWYHGHSWAHGLYAAMDGKDQESSSEDMMHAYALKMWGKTSGNANLEARGNLQLAILARSLSNYYLYTSDNTVQPKNFIGNKVAGIMFENKVDHTTYFDANIEAIQGIHMIPILPATPYTRSKEFVREEWEVYFSNGRIDKIGNAWKGIIWASYATVDPRKAWEFFSSRGFNGQWLDGGASLTWFLAYSAALGGI